MRDDELFLSSVLDAFAAVCDGRWTWDCFERNVVDWKNDLEKEKIQLYGSTGAYWTCCPC